MNKKIIIIIVVVIALIGGGIGAAWSLGYFGSDESVSSDESKPKVKLDDDPSFYPLKEVIISLKQPGNARFMQLEMSLMSHDPRMEDQVAAMDTIMQNTIFQYFSGRDQSDIRDEMEDLETFQESLKQALISAADNYGRPLAVERVLLTNVIIQ